MLELLAIQLTLDTGVRLSKSHVRNVLLEPLMEAVDAFIEGARPFPATQVSLLAHAA